MGNILDMTDKYCSKLCKLVYNNSIKEQDMQEITPHGLEFKSFVKVIEVDIEMMICFHTKNILFYVFRGTDDINDWKTNISLKKTYHKGLGIHTGFFKSWTHLKQDIKKTYLDSNVLHIFTGHSKGGAEAVVCSYMFKEYLNREKEDRNNTTVECVTFASPRVGDKKFKMDYNSKIKHKRYQTIFDLVPWVPRYTLGYRHTGKAIWVPIVKTPILSHNIDNYIEYFN